MAKKSTDSDKPTPKPKKKPAAKPTTRRSRVKSVPVTPDASVRHVTPADIALRAYGIYEERQKLGIPGDSASDWAEAERQLQLEAVAAQEGKHHFHFHWPFHLKRDTPTEE